MLVIYLSTEETKMISFIILLLNPYFQLFFSLFTASKIDYISSGILLSAVCVL